MPRWLTFFTWPLLVAAFAVTFYIVLAQQEMVDFEVYRQAAGRAMHAENLYRPTDGHYQYKYLPAFAFAVTPFAIVEDRVARLAWYALSFGLLCAFIRVSAHAVPARRLAAGTLMASAVVLVGRLYGHELDLGQTNVLFAVTLMGALLAAEAGARRTAGALVALGVFIKPYALILVPWVWLVAGAPGLIAGAVALALGLLLPALAYGWQGNIDQVIGWYRTVTDTSAPNLFAKENISFATLWAKWIGGGRLAAGLALVTSGITLLVAAFVMSRRRTVREPAYLDFALLMLLIPMLSPQGWDYVLLIATPAVMILIDRWREVTVGWRTITALGLGLLIPNFSGPPFNHFPILTTILTICGLMLMACLVNIRLRQLA